MIDVGRQSAKSAKSNLEKSAPLGKNFAPVDHQGPKDYNKIVEKYILEGILFLKKG